MQLPIAVRETSSMTLSDLELDTLASSLQSSHWPWQIEHGLVKSIAGRAVDFIKDSDGGARKR